METMATMEGSGATTKQNKNTNAVVAAAAQTVVTEKHKQEPKAMNQWKDEQ